MHPSSNIISLLHTKNMQPRSAIPLGQTRSLHSSSSMDHSVRSPTEAYDGSSAEAHAGPPAGDNIESPADQHSVEYKLDAIDVEAVKLSTGSRLLKLETNVVAKDFIAQSLKDRLKEDVHIPCRYKSR